MNVWICKYALTTGLFEIEAEKIEEKRMAKQVNSKFPTFYHGDEWAASKAEAISIAETMRTKKIASIKKQLAKVESLTFE